MHPFSESSLLRQSFRTFTDRACSSGKSSQVLSILLALLVVSSSLTFRPGQAKVETLESTKNGQPSLSSLLNPDGTLNMSSGFNGSLDTRGWRMKLGAKGEPHFIREAAQCAPGDQYWDTQFKLAGADGPVYAMAVNGDDVYVGGSFRSAGNINANRVAKWNRQSNTWSALGNGVSGDVRAIAVSGADIYVGGSFTTAFQSNGSIISVNRIARWGGDSWSPVANSSGTPGNGVDGDVHAIAVSGNDVYVGGSFRNAGGSSANRIAKWSKLNGNWSALGAGSGPTGNGVSGDVYAITVHVTGLVYVGGSFLTAYSFDNSTGLSVNNVAYWNGGQWAGLGLSYTPSPGNGVNGVVTAIAVGQGGIYVGGCFTEAYNSTGNFISASNIARWNGASWSDLSFNTGSTLKGVNSCVTDIEVSGADLYVSGHFTTAYNGSGVGVSVNRIAK